MGSVSPDTISLVWSLVVAVIVVYGFITLITNYEDTVTEIKDTQVKHGDDTLGELYLNISPELFFFLRIVVAGMWFLIGSALLNVLLGIILATVGYIVPKIVLNNLKKQRVIKVEQQLVEGLELLGSSLKSGLTLQQATELLVKEFPAPVSQEFAVVISETRLGIDFNDALTNMAERLNSNVVRVLAAGVAITKRCGGDLTVIFQNIAQTIRDQANIEGKLDAVTAQGRFQGLVLGLMPFALIILLYFVDRSHVETLFGYQLGLWAIGLVIIMVGMAQLWIRKLMDIDI